MKKVGARSLYLWTFLNMNFCWCKPSRTACENSEAKGGSQIDLLMNFTEYDPLLVHLQELHVRIELFKKERKKRAKGGAKSIYLWTLLNMELLVHLQGLHIRIIL